MACIMKFMQRIASLVSLLCRPDGKPRPGTQPVVRDLTCQFPAGSRVLLLGANGAGKTTLLKVIGGQHMVSEEAVLVLGESPFHATHLTSSHQLGYVGGEWERDVAFGGYKVPLAVSNVGGCLNLNGGADFGVAERGFEG